MKLVLALLLNSAVVFASSKEDNHSAPFDPYAVAPGTTIDTLKPLEVATSVMTTIWDAIVADCKSQILPLPTAAKQSIA